MKIKTSKLSGAALDWAVKKAIKKDGGYFLPSKNYKNISHSTNWAHGGPIIEREGIALGQTGDGWEATCDGCIYISGPTLLIAAMRCYVASKLGEEVGVPEEVCIV